MRGSAIETSRSRNSHMRGPRSVTLAPIGMQEKTVKDKHVYVRVCKRVDCGQEIDK